MPSWNEHQHPDEKSPDHGKRDHGHGPGEHGLGGQRDEAHEKPPRQAPTDVSIQEPTDETIGSRSDPEAAEPLAGVSLPSTFYIGSVPPVTNQGTTPQCVAYSNAYDANQQDRPELGRFHQLDEPLFFREIGGGANGAYLTAGLARRVAYGYPEDVLVPAAQGYPAEDGSVDAGDHRLAGYSQIALTPTAIKAALMLGHGVLFIGDWFHSWFHPLASGKLPAPDYVVGGHAIWCRGWNDTYGFRLRNSWGTRWGPLGGDCFLPYAFLGHEFAAYRTSDR